MGPPHGPARLAGTSLIEALLALLVLAVGLLGLGRLQVGLQADADIARQRGDAMRLTQSAFEALRQPPRSDDDGTSPALGADDSTRWPPLGPNVPGPLPPLAPDATGTAFQVERRFDVPPTTGDAIAVRLATTWTDRRGHPDRVELDGMLSPTDPGVAALLGWRRGRAWPHAAPGAAPRLPAGVIDLRDGRSVLLPTGPDGVTLVFDTLTGQVVARCTGGSPIQPGGEIDPARLENCNAIAGYWLGGVVRLDPRLPPDPAWQSDLPAPFSIRLVLTDGWYPHAADCRVGVVAQPGGDRYATWHCAVYPRLDGRWSGRLSLVPEGWTIGAEAGSRQVCRYVDPDDPEPKGDAESTYPAVYTDVQGNRPNQNFLLIDGEDTCPATGNNGNHPAPPEPDPDPP